MLWGLPRVQRLCTVLLELPRILLYTGLLGQLGLRAMRLGWARVAEASRGACGFATAQGRVQDGQTDRDGELIGGKGELKRRQPLTYQGLGLGGNKAQNGLY